MKELAAKLWLDLGKGIGFTLAFMLIVLVAGALSYLGKLPGQNFENTIVWSAVAYFGGGVGKAWSDSKAMAGPSSLPS